MRERNRGRGENQKSKIQQNRYDEDQAKRLRELMKRVVTIASGKGGVGKTTLSVNIANEISKMGKKVMLVDADLSLANADMLLGVIPKRHIGHYIEGNAPLRSVVVRVRPNFEFIPAASGVTKLTKLTENQFRKIKAIVSDTNSNIVIFDSAAGIGQNVIRFSLISSTVLLVVSPDPVSITDSYALIKVITKSGYSGRIFVVINMVTNEKEKHIAFNTLKKVSEKYLGLSPEFLGYVPWDEKVKESFKLQKLVTEAFPNSQASYHIRKISEELIKRM